MQRYGLSLFDDIVTQVLRIVNAPDVLYVRTAQACLQGVLRPIFVRTKVLPLQIGGAV